MSFTNITSNTILLSTTIVVAAAAAAADRFRSGGSQHQGNTVIASLPNLVYGAKRNKNPAHVSFNILTIICETNSTNKY